MTQTSSIYYYYCIIIVVDAIFLTKLSQLNVYPLEKLEMLVISPHYQQNLKSFKNP